MGFKFGCTGSPEIAMRAAAFQSTAFMYLPDVGSKIFLQHLLTAVRTGNRFWPFILDRARFMRMLGEFVVPQLLDRTEPRLTLVTGELLLLVVDQLVHLFKVRQTVRSADKVKQVFRILKVLLVVWVILSVFGSNDTYRKSQQLHVWSSRSIRWEFHRWLAIVAHRLLPRPQSLMGHRNLSSGDGCCRWHRRWCLWLSSRRNRILHPFNSQLFARIQTGVRNKFQLNNIETSA